MDDWPSLIGLVEAGVVGELTPVRAGRSDMLRPAAEHPALAAAFTARRREGLGR